MVTCTRKKPQSVADRLRWFAPHIDGYKTWLRREGLSREVTITKTVASARLLGRVAPHRWIRSGYYRARASTPPPPCSRAAEQPGLRVAPPR